MCPLDIKNQLNNRKDKSKKKKKFNSNSSQITINLQKFTRTKIRTILIL